MNKTNVKANPSTTYRHDTPNNKTHIIKFRVTAEEKASLELTCKLLNAQLASEKAKFYEQYKESKEELLKLKTAKQNVASFFREEEPAQQER